MSDENELRLLSDFLNAKFIRIVTDYLLLTEKGEMYNYICRREPLRNGWSLYVMTVSAKFNVDNRES